MLIKPVQKIAIEISWRLVNDPQYRQQAYDVGVKILDLFQVKAGNVNLHSQEEAVDIAANTCIRKDRESQVRVVEECNCIVYAT